MQTTPVAVVELGLLAEMQAVVSQETVALDRQAQLAAHL
jgi:hypothetical protein